MALTVKPASRTRNLIMLSASGDQHGDVGPLLTDDAISAALCPASARAAGLSASSWRGLPVLEETALDVRFIN